MTRHYFDDDPAIRAVLAADPALGEAAAQGGGLQPGTGWAFIHSDTREIVTVLAADLRDKPDLTAWIHARLRGVKHAGVVFLAEVTLGAGGEDKSG